MSFQKGNGFGKRSRLFERALQRAIENDRTALDRIAKNLLDMAESPSAEVALPAINLLANRLDGKPHQTIAATVEHTVETGDEFSIAERIAAAARARSSPSVQ